MTTLAPERASLEELTSDELSELAGLDGGWAREAALSVLAQRQGLRCPAPSPVTEWEAASHAQFLAASAACNGHLLSPLGRRRLALRRNAGEWPALWEGPEHVARAWASEELRAFWDEHGRVPPLTSYRNGLAASRRDEQEAASRENPGCGNHDSQVKDRDDDMDILAGQTLNGHAGAGEDAGESALLDALPGAPPRPGPPAELDGVTCLAAVPERRMVPLDLGGIPLVIPRADVTLLFGQGAIGKGRMTWAVIAAVTRAGGDVIVIMPEDKADEAMAERGRAAGADMTRVWDMTKLPGSASRFKLSAAERHEGHVGHLRGFIETLREHGRKPLLVVIDPISAVVGWGTILTVAGARRLVEPLQDMADETGVAVLAVGHTTKDGKLAGSAGLAQALRLVYRVAVDPLNGAHRVITAEKANNLPPGSDGLRFTITEDEAGRPRVEWLDKAAIERQRTSWRDEVPATPATGSGYRPPAVFAAAWSIRRPGCPPEAHPFEGSWRGLAAAQDACQASASEPLTWQPSARRPGCWTATTYPSGPDGPEVSYAVSTANGRQS